MNTNQSSVNKRVLIIAYHFPPNASSGTFRTLKFVKYLPQFGWDPIVLTVEPHHEHIEPMDPSLVHQVPQGVPVIRTYAWSPQKLRKRNNPTPPAQVTDEAHNCAQFSWIKRLIKLALLFVQFPDRCSGWYPFAVWRGWRLIRHYRVDVIYSSGPPFTGTLVGLTLKLLTGKPLVSDFRDPWGDKTYGRTPEEVPLTRNNRWVHSLKTKIYTHSTFILNVSADLTAKAQSALPKDLHSKFVTVLNGFDPNDFPSFPPRPSDKKFRIVYTGYFYAGMREPREFLLALQIIANRYPKDFTQFETWFVGDMQWLHSNSSWVTSLQLGEHVQFMPFVPHRENLALLAQSDLLLMIGSIKKADTGNLPAKVFEYAATKCPILALVHEGEAARFVRECGTGRVANPEDPEEIAAVLLQMYREIHAGTFPIQPNEAFLRQYDRRELTRQLGALFDEVTNPTGTRR
jgi:glycosyltransferase involved in cell wall biosynthesis